MTRTPQARHSTKPLAGRISRPARGRSGLPSAAGRRFRPGWLHSLAAVFALIGSAVFLYPDVAAWFSQYNQSSVIGTLGRVDPAHPVNLGPAHDYNRALSSGAVLEANHRIPSGTGTSSSGSTGTYESLLQAGPNGLMGRIRIPSINVDLPIYHGTSDDTLLKGVGHLEGTSLPVGGPDTHTVLTAHRGLASATMFSNLDQLKVGETFTLEVEGQILTYRVFETQVVEPSETRALRTQTGKDLATLVTCTPLGVNSHRILVTGERVLPTPSHELEVAGQRPDIPGFPWWAVWIGGMFLLVLGYWIWAGRRRGRLLAEPAPTDQGTTPEAIVPQ